jgi:hypothetical protein
MQTVKYVQFEDGNRQFIRMDQFQALLDQGTPVKVLETRVM